MHWIKETPRKLFFSVVVSALATATATAAESPSASVASAQRPAWANKLVSISHFAVEPDGSRVVFQNLLGQLIAQTVASGEQKILLTSDARVRSFDGLSPHGRYAWLTDRTEPGAKYSVLDTLSGAVLPIPHTRTPHAGTAWRADGLQYAFAAYEQPRMLGLFVFDLYEYRQDILRGWAQPTGFYLQELSVPDFEGGLLECLPTPYGGAPLPPRPGAPSGLSLLAFSPSGHYLAYKATRSSGQDTMHLLVVQSLLNDTLVFSKHFDVTSFQWVADDEILVYGTDKQSGGGTGLFAVRTDGSVFEKVADSLTSLWAASPDGRYVFYKSTLGAGGALQFYWMDRALGRTIPMLSSRIRNTTAQAQLQNNGDVWLANPSLDVENPLPDLIRLPAKALQELWAESADGIARVDESEDALQAVGKIRWFEEISPAQPEVSQSLAFSELEVELRPVAPGSSNEELVARYTVTNRSDHPVALAATSVRGEIYDAAGTIIIQGFGSLDSRGGFFMLPGEQQTAEIKFSRTPHGPSGTQFKVYVYLPSLGDGTGKEAVFSVP